MQSMFLNFFFFFSLYPSGSVALASDLKKINKKLSIPIQDSLIHLRHGTRSCTRLDRASPRWFAP